MVTPFFSKMSDKFEDNVHGGADPTELAQHGLHPEQVLDFSANLNPFGPSPAVRLALRDAAIDHYPDRMCRELCCELARRHGVDEKQVLAGNGSSELIWLTALACLRDGDDVIILGPAFGEYERSARLMKANVLVYRAIPEEGFCPLVDAFAKGLSERQPRLAFITNPNNPTGQTVALDWVAALASRHSQTLFVLDEAYADCMSSSSRQDVDWPANVLRLRSLTKTYGLAGVRLGYAVGDKDVIAALRGTQPPWSVNALAQAAGLASLRDERRLQVSLDQWTVAKIELVDQLQKAGFAPVPSSVPFFLLPVSNALRMRSILLRRGILVRDCTSFGLPKYIRISSRRRDENVRLVAALLEAREEIDSCND